MQTLIAIKPLRYGTRRMQAGDTFSATPRDARILIGIKKARDVNARDVGALPPPPAPLQKQPSRQNPAAAPAKDSDAALRQTYLELTGRKAFANWKTETLERLIAEARAARQDADAGLGQAGGAPDADQSGQ
jgi:hypothetical protein